MVSVRDLLWGQLYTTHRKLVVCSHECINLFHICKYNCLCLFAHDPKFLFRFTKFPSNNNFASNNCAVELIKNNCLWNKLNLATHNCPSDKRFLILSLVFKEFKFHDIGHFFAATPRSIKQQPERRIFQKYITTNINTSR